jgi:hypothetical protein
MSDDLQARADARLDEALSAQGARDPRGFYRDRLRSLRSADRDAYERAVAHYRDTLLPSIADGGADPLSAWTEYGRLLAELTAPGRTVALDASGRARAYEAPADPAHLVLHVPDGPRTPTMVVALPADMSAAQRASYDWLVGGRTSMKDAS